MWFKVIVHTTSIYLGVIQDLPHSWRFCYVKDQNQCQELKKWSKVLTKIHYDNWRFWNSDNWFINKSKYSLKLKWVSYIQYILLFFFFFFIWNGFDTSLIQNRIYQFLSLMFRFLDGKLDSVKNVYTICLSLYLTFFH